MSIARFTAAIIGAMMGAAAVGSAQAVTAPAQIYRADKALLEYTSACPRGSRWDARLGRCVDTVPRPTRP